MTISIKLTSILFLAAFILISCKTTNVNVERGSNYTFRVGYPEIRLSAVGIISDDDIPIISTSTELMFSSLIYKNSSNDRVAEILFELQIINKITGTLISFNDTYQIIDNAESRALNLDSYQIQKTFTVEPGYYVITAKVTDNNSQKDISLTTETFIPDPTNPEINLTNILLLSKDNESIFPDYFPITTYDVPLKMDSLRFEFQATNNDSRDPITISAKLIQYQSDTLAANPMSYNNYLSSSIGYRGIDYRNKTEIATTTRRLTQPGSVYIEFTYPILPRGNYRFEVTTKDASNNEIYKARDFSIKSENYPLISDVREIAAPLIYLMSAKDHQTLMKIKNEAELKQAVDRFWLEAIGNPNIAREVIQKYYDRVEQANKLFSNYKEGWKTDMGMIYILYGQPWYVQESFKRMTWSYSYNANDFFTNFSFIKPKKNSKFYPFDNYLLNRTSDYFNVEYRQRELWLSGQILTENL